MKETQTLFFVLTAVSLLAVPIYSVGQHAPASPPAFGQASHQGQFPALWQGGSQYWDNGYLIAWAWGDHYASPIRPVIALYDKYGRMAREAVVWFDGADVVTVGGVAVSRSGQLVAVGGIGNPKGVVATYIAEIGQDNRVQRVIRTSPFSPYYVCAMEDGTVWSYGIDRDEHLNAIQNSLRLRQYSFEKGQLRALLDSSALDQGWEMVRGRYFGETSLRCNSKTVVLYNGGSGELVELDPPTSTLKVTKVAPLPSPPEFLVTGFALTESGDIFASFLDRRQFPKKPVVSGLFRLSRDNAGGGKWVPVDGTVGSVLHDLPILRLVGADGDDLVYTRLKDGRMYWSKRPSQ